MGEHGLTTRVLPPGWGADPLSSFLDGAHGNVLAAFERRNAQFSRLGEIDDLFRRIAETRVSHGETPLRLFLLRSHTAFLGGTNVCLCGLPPEAYMVLRGCLEAALYGCHVAVNPNTFSVWINRHQDDASRKQAKSEFAFGRILSSLRELHQATSGVAKTLYEELIDLGAHPNELSIMAQLEKGTAPGEDFNFLNLVTGEHPQYQLCLRRTAQVGVCALQIYWRADPQRIEELRLGSALDKLGQGL